MQCFQRATDLKSRFSFTDGTGLRWLRNTAYMFAERSIDPLVAKKLVTHCLRRTLSTPTSETLEIQALLPYLLPDTTTPLNACLLDPDADFSSLSRMTSATVHRCDPVTVLKVKRCSGLLLQMVLIQSHPNPQCRALATVELSKDEASVEMARSLLAKSSQARFAIVESNPPPYFLPDLNHISCPLNAGRPLGN